MTDINENLTTLETRLVELEGTIQGTEAITSAFRVEMEDVSATMKGASQDASALSRKLGTSLKSAFTGLIFDGDRASDALRQVGRSLTGSVLNAALKPVSGAIGDAVGGFFGGLFANGGVMASGRVQAFAKGGIVDGPTSFPMRGGQMGLMGEAGPEAIMPLARGADGKLGVRAGAGGRGGVNITMNIATPDVAGFSRSQSQIAAQMSRAMNRSNRNL